jgi:hypothetical protein
MLHHLDLRREGQQMIRLGIPALIGAVVCAGNAGADTTDVRWQNRVIIEKQGE